MKHQWFRNYSTKTLKIRKVAIKFISFSNKSLRRIISDHRRSSNEISMFRRLGQKKTFLMVNVCNEIFAENSMVLQRIINESPMKQQWNISDSEVNTTETIKVKTISIELINNSNMSLQKIINNHQRSSNATSMFRRLGPKKHLWSLMFAKRLR